MDQNNIPLVTQTNQPLQTTPEPQPQQPQPHPHAVLLGILGIILIILVLAALWLFSSSDGQLLLNKYFPTPERTLSVIKKKANMVSSYNAQGAIAIGTSTSNSFTINAANNDSELSVKYQNKSSIDFGTLTAQVRTNQSQSYGQDLFDGTWHKVSEGVENRLNIEEILSLTPKNLTHAFCGTIDSSQFEIKDGTFTLNCKNSSTVQPFKEITTLHVSVNSTTYEVEAVSMVGKTIKGSDISLEITFQNQNKKIQITQAPTVLNPFGDYFARETLVINKDQGKSFDYFWNGWEQVNFNCTKCVNPLADSDNDGVNNALEFLFATDPHTTSGVQFPATFTPSTSMYMSSFAFTPLNSPQKSFAPYTIRQTTAKVPVMFKKDAKILTLVHESDLAAGDYVTVFINNNLAQVIELGSKASDWVNIPVSNYAGSTGDITVVLNPYGKDHYSFRGTGSFDVKFPNLHMDPLNKTNPFYLDATTASLAQLSSVRTPVTTDTRWKIGTNRVLEWYGPADTAYSLTILDSKTNQPIGRIATTEGAEAGDKQHGYAWVVGSYQTIINPESRTLPAGNYKIIAEYVTSSQQIDFVPVAVVTLY